MRARRSLPAALVAGLLLIGLAPAHAASKPRLTTRTVSTTPSVVPVWAYYYLWFNASSWNRAKRDYPAVGRYSSDEKSVMVTHIRQARAAGITGFLVSWKDTALNDRRLDLLTEAAREEDFALGLVYQGLDVRREPLPVAQVRADLVVFSGRWGQDRAFRRAGDPLVVWAGTWRFSVAEVALVSRAVRPRLALLGSERHMDRWSQVGPLLDGNAYYWSSLDPVRDKRAGERLRTMGDRVHSTGGRWIPSVAPGFDARLIGGQRVVERRDGQTLRDEWALAVGSSPDAVGVISWNEFTENTFIEPSRDLGSSALRTLTSLTQAPGPTGELDSSMPGTTARGTPWRFALVLGLLVALGVAAVARSVGRSPALVRTPEERHT